MFNSGYIKIHRKITDWGWYKDQNTKDLFLHLLLKANYKESEFMGHLIKRGELIFGREKASEETGISQQSIRTSLEHLKSTREITIRSTNKFSIITICNYDNYQDKDFETNQQINHETNQQLTGNQPATNQQLTTSEEEKERKKIKKERRIHIFTPPTFDEFEKFCDEHGFKNIAKKAFEYYSTADWHDSTGKKIKNWKQKLIAVWFREENKDKSDIPPPQNKPRQFNPL